VTTLSININKIALIRNSRGQNQPHILTVAQDLIQFGAEGITVHPRPDGRHILFEDLLPLKNTIHPIELNIEGYPSKEWLNQVFRTQPAQCTLVPDPPEALTSNAGWNVTTQQPFLEQTLKKFQDYPIRLSVFIDPFNTSKEELSLLKKWGCHRIELFTQTFSQHYQNPQIVQTYIDCAKQAQDVGLDINAGHDLNLQNLPHLLHAIPTIKEVSIGHAFVCESLYLGFEKTLSLYQNILKNTPTF